MLTLKIIFFVGLFLAFYTYIGYGILLWVMVKVKDKVTDTQHISSIIKDYPNVSLLIAAYNEEDVVAEKMDNTNKLIYPEGKLNVIWITDGSNDSTNERLKSYSNVRILFQPERQGKTAALNRALPLIDSEIVVFTDANTMINNDAIENIVKCFQDKRVGCVAGEKRIFQNKSDGAAVGGEGLYWRYESKLKSLDSKLNTAVGAAGELFAIRRELFEPMQNDTLLDDFILSMHIAQKGFKIRYCDKSYAIENGSADMKEEEKRKVRIAAGGLQSIWRLRALLNIFKYKMLSFQYISHRVLRWSITPIFLFLLIPLNVLIIYLDPTDIFYFIMLILQIIFYLSGCLGYYLSKRSIKNKFLYIPYYFLFMNLNVINGFYYLYKKKGTGTWEKAKRA